MPIYLDDGQAMVYRSGRTCDGRQFMLTRPVQCADNRFIALCLFSATGDLLECKFEHLDLHHEKDQADEVRKRLLAPLGEITNGWIKVAPFRVERDGLNVGFNDDPQEPSERKIDDFLFHPCGEFAHLGPDEILRRVAPAFLHVSIDKAQGNRLIQERRKRLIALKAPDVVLQSLVLGTEAFVTLADDDRGELAVRFYVQRCEPIIIDYPQPAHREQCWTTLQKLAQVLDYELERADEWPGDYFADAVLVHWNLRCDTCNVQLEWPEARSPEDPSWDKRMGQFARDAGWLVDRRVLRTTWVIACPLCRGD